MHSSRLQAFCVSALLTVGVLGTVLLSGCGPQPSANAPVDPASVPLKFSVPKIEQYRKIGNRSADGQYIVIRLNIQNDGVKTESVKPEDILLTNNTDNPAEKFTQNLESNLFVPFMQEFGMENKDRLLENTTLTINPRIKMDRYAIFMIPETAALDNYNLLYKPYNLEIPLLSEVTVVDDRRTFEGR